MDDDWMASQDRSADGADIQSAGWGWRKVPQAADDWSGQLQWQTRHSVCKLTTVNLSASVGEKMTSLILELNTFGDKNVNIILWESKLLQLMLKKVALINFFK